MPVFIAYPIRDQRLYNLAIKYFVKYGFKPINVENMHLTVLFIGDPSSVYLARIYKEVKDLLEEYSYLRLHVKGLTILPPTKSTHVAVVLENDTRLIEFRAKLLEKINRIYQVRDRFSFLPHITIARRNKQKLHQKISENELYNTIEIASKELPRNIIVYKPYILITSPKGYIVYGLKNE